MEYIQNKTEQTIIMPEMEDKAKIDMRFSEAAFTTQTYNSEQISVEHVYGLLSSTGRFQESKK